MCYDPSLGLDRVNDVVLMVTSSEEIGLLLSSRCLQFGLKNCCWDRVASGMTC